MKKFKSNILFILKKLKIFLLLIFFSSIFLSAKSQDILDFNTVNTKTYDYYFQGNWDSLIDIGEKALKSDIDYFYLRIRLGIAYYAKTNYRKAIIHLEKAYKYNSSDLTTLEYLYLSYINSMRTADAIALAKDLPTSLKEEFNISKNKFINSVYFETGPILSNNIMKNGGLVLNKFNYFYTEADLVDDVYYTHFGFKQNIKKRVSLYYGYSNININRQKIITRGIFDTIDNYSTKQNEFYINARVFLGNGYNLTPAFHLINDEYQSFEFKGFDTIYFLPNYRKIDTSFNNIVASLSLTKDYSIFNFNLFGTYSDLNNREQKTYGLSLTCYPEGNLNIYKNSTLANFNENKKDRLIFHQLIGFKLSTKTWFEGWVTFGNVENYNESNAFIVYNIPDEVDYKYGGSLILSLSENIELSLRYINTSKKSSYIYYRTVGQKENETKQITYTNQSIIGGIKWKF